MKTLESVAERPVRTAGLRVKVTDRPAVPGTTLRFRDIGEEMRHLHDLSEAVRSRLALSTETLPDGFSG